MSSLDSPAPDRPEPESPGGDVPLIDLRVARRVGMLVVVVAAGALVLFSVLQRRGGPTPAELAGDPLLSQGYHVYMSRCASCHGERGRGDGPIARSLTGGPPPRDLTAGQWKHGDQPDQVLAVISQGIPGSNMSGFGKFKILSEDDIRAVAAYVYRLAGRDVPSALRK